MEEPVMSRAISQAMDELIGKKFPVLNDGHVVLVDYMGDDSAIVQAARVSYGKGTKKISEDRGLIRYLMRHRHCYHPSMEVLTDRGWIRWDECNSHEVFLVPDPKMRSMRHEMLQVEAFDAEEDMISFDSDRMSFCVTPDHRMWFKGKYQDSFQIVRAGEMSHWGHFDPLLGYKFVDLEGERDPQAEFIGFYLGDGSYASPNRVVFHLKKDRKKETLKRLLETLKLEHSIHQSSTYEDALVTYVETPDFLRRSIDLQARDRDKRLSQEFESELIGQPAKVRGLFFGLLGSDGYENPDRPQWSFSSTSDHLLKLFEKLASWMGVDAHKSSAYMTAYYGSRTSLEARKQYFGTKRHEGKVYCATTSTGLLMVRGSCDKFAFVCGNTTPFEMCELKIRVRIPMDAWRQYIRHRTANVNEYSTRYSIAIDACQETEPHEWRLQSSNNKQGSKGFADEEVGKKLTERERAFQKTARDVYEERLEAGIAKEQARKDLPLSNYTEAYWKIDLHNLFHFLSLRMDKHAQKEIRDYANVIGNEIVKIWCPIAWEAFIDYRMESMQLSRLEIMVLEYLHGDGPAAATAKAYVLGWLEDDGKGGYKKNREREEFEEKLAKLGHKIPWVKTG